MTPKKLTRAGFSSSPVEATFAQSALGLDLLQVLVDAKGSNAAIADFLLRNPVRATAWGIEELAQQTGTSTATLSRFARTLGFGGYAALRSAIADALQTALQPVFHPVEKLKDALGRSGHAAPGGNPVITESLDSSRRYGLYPGVRSQRPSGGNARAAPAAVLQTGDQRS